MLRYLAILFLLSGFSYQAQAELTVGVNGSLGRGNCPYADGNVVVTVKGGEKASTATVTIECAANASDTKTQRWSKELTFNDSGEAVTENIILANHNMSTGDHCTAEASANSETATADFKVSYRQIGGAPQAEIAGGSIMAGKEFNIEKLHFTSEIPFFDLLLRECTASSDPWMFWTDSNSVLHRVYPTSSNSESRTTVEDKDPSNDNSCLGMYDGELRHLVTIGDDHTSCKFKLVKEDVTGGDSFTEQGVPTLGGNATVTQENGTVMLHTGVKPSDPANIKDSIVVHISTNRGFTWSKSSLVAWTSAATDSGVAAAEGNTDNTRNMAMIKITDGTSVWWRIIKGQ